MIYFEVSLGKMIFEVTITKITSSQRKNQDGEDLKEKINQDQFFMISL